MGPVSTHACSPESRATNSSLFPRSNRLCERKNISERKLGLGGWSDRSPAVLRSSRWVQLSRRVNLKWTRRDGTLTFNIRGARKSGPTARRSGVGKTGGQSWCAAARERAWSPPRSSCFDSLRARDPLKMTGRHDRPRIRCDQRALASTLLANLSTRLPHQMVSARRAFPSKPASLGGNRLILLWFGPRLSVSPVEPVIGP